MASVVSASQFANSGIGLMGRIMLTTDAVAYRADISSITYEVFVNSASQAPAVTGSLTVSDVMLTALADWDHDEEGYTFLYSAPGTLWPTVGTTYVFRALFTPVAGKGAAFYCSWRVTATDSRA